ncbi:hypothetical protein [Corynebacterium durum]|jgi:hypothetical protein|uniref:hypothetical protein n=1 Tax=Corynebacterium durum TaxID=61592 RepID=UPI0028EA3008|nr:hypothetical protein [Corynebacterium durum]
MSSARSGGVPGRRGRRRVERPSTAPFVDRSWDQPGAEDLFSLGERSPDERRERDAVVEVHNADMQDADSVELNEEFWISEKPPHWG